MLSFQIYTEIFTILNNTLLIQVIGQDQKVSRIHELSHVTTVYMTAVNTLQEHTALVVAVVVSDNLSIVVAVVVEEGVVD